MGRLESAVRIHRLTLDQVPVAFSAWEMALTSVFLKTTFFLSDPEASWYETLLSVFVLWGHSVLLRCDKGSERPLCVLTSLDGICLFLLHTFHGW